MANQMIALQARGPQLPDIGAVTSRYANIMGQMANMEKLRRESADAAAIRNVMSDPSFNPTDAASINKLINLGPIGVEAASKVMQAQKLGGELVTSRQQQAEKRAGLIGANLIGILRDPSDESLSQAAQTFKSVGMDPAEFQPVLSQIQQIPDANQRKVFALQFIAQTPGARDALKFVMPDVKETKVGDATVFIDNNSGSPTFGQELFRITASPEPVKLNQQVVEGTLYNVNPITGIAGEATIGDPTASLIPGPRTLTRTDTGVVSPYAVGGAPAAGFVPPPSPMPSAGAPAPGAAVPMPSVRVGELTVERLRPVIVAQESGGNYTKVSPKGALGAYQVMPVTGRSLADRLGMEWRPDLMTANTPEARQYQDTIGAAAIQEAISAGGGDLVTTAKYYHGGSNRANWGPKTNKYAADIVSRMGGRPSAAAAPTSTTTGAPPAPTTPTPGRTISDVQRAKAAKLVIPLIGYNVKTGSNAVSNLISASTSGGLEKIGSDVVGFFGTATSGAKAIGQLSTIKDNMTYEKLRGKLGAQISDADVRLIANTMGDIADASIPAETRLAKWNNVVLPLLLRNAGLPPKEAIDYLRKNPNTRAEFDRKYWGTSAAEVLGR